MNKSIKILFTGPECSGKTTLSQWLSQRNNWTLVEEEAREYLTRFGPDYTQDDVSFIAERQWKSEMAASSMPFPYICDTDQLTFLIWQREKYGHRDPLAETRWLNSLPDICFLCLPDIDWVFDPLRENPYDRDRLVSLYIGELQSQHIDYIPLGGGEAKRQQDIKDTLLRML